MDEAYDRLAITLENGSVTSRFNLANFLAASRREQDLEVAKKIYIQLINEIPDDLGAWVNLGILLFETGYTSAAHTAFLAAATYHPQNATAHAYLGNVLLYKDDLTAARMHYEIVLDLNPELAEMHRGLAVIFQRIGNEEKSLYHRNIGFKNKPLFSLSYLGRGNPASLLILTSSREGNIPWRLLVDRNVFDTTIITVEYFDSPLPPHHLIFNTIGDADLCQDELVKANRFLEQVTTPVINHSNAVLHTGRLTNTRRLGMLAGVTSPQMALISKTDFYAKQAPDILTKHALSYPILLRSPGFHGGNYFLQVNSLRELNCAFHELPGENLLAIEFLDSRNGDALFRKFRVMSINGILYPLHMAISSDWNVHYFSSDMETNELYRKEEESFLNDFYAYLQPRTIEALKLITLTIALDYCGIDFGIGKNGDVLLYEANPTMAIIPPPHEKKWAYRRTAIKNALNATRNMLIEKLAQNNY